MPSPDKYIKVRGGSFPCKYANEATTSYLHAIKTDLKNRVPLRKPCFQGICKTKCYPCNRNFRFGLFLQNLILFSRCDFWSYSCKNRLTRSYPYKQEVKIPIQSPLSRFWENGEEMTIFHNNNIEEMTIL